MGVPERGAGQGKRYKRTFANSSMAVYVERRVPQPRLGSSGIEDDAGCSSQE